LVERKKKGANEKSKIFLMGVMGRLAATKTYQKAATKKKQHLTANSLKNNRQKNLMRKARSVSVLSISKC
jgi:hypothetical protein